VRKGIKTIIIMKKFGIIAFSVNCFLHNVDFVYLIKAALNSFELELCEVRCSLDAKYIFLQQIALDYIEAITLLV